MKLNKVFDKLLAKFQAPIMDCTEARRVWSSRGYHLICSEEDPETMKQECQEATVVAAKYGERIVCLEYPSYRIIQ